MKLSTAVATILALAMAAPRPTSAQLDASTSCIDFGFRISFEDHCTYESILSAYQTKYNADNVKRDDCPVDRTAQEDMWIRLGAAHEAAARDAVHQVCLGAYERDESIPFTDIAMKGTNFSFEERYYNGYTIWNEETQTDYPLDEDGNPTNVLRNDARRVRQFYEGLGQTARVDWPGSMSNFDLDTCTTNAAMCCWPRDRQAGDNNGNCNTPYDVNCVDKGPADNTDLCHVDLEKGQKSTKFDSSGTAAFPRDDGNVNDGDAVGEGRIHCHGFAWANDDADFTSQYKANNLFYVSMYDHMHQRGYVENIPGAPMCACVEQMPIVSRSDCTEIDVDETFEVIFGVENGNVVAHLRDIEIDFNSCDGLYNQGNDLWAYMGRLYKEKKVTSRQYAALGEVLVEERNCKWATRYHMNDEGYTVGFNSDMFRQVAGKESFEMESLGREAFNTEFAESPNKIVLRVCPHCYPDFQYIYYKRITPLEDLDLLQELTTERNQNSNNIHGVDFHLYSDYYAAVNDVNNTGVGAWDCDYMYWDIFPGRCGPNGPVSGQGRRFELGPGLDRPEVAFYVETAAGADPIFEDVSENPLRFGDMTSVDVGLAIERPGNAIASENGTVVHITGAGDDIWGPGPKGDEFHYYYETIPGGDFTIVAHIKDFDDNDYHWAKVGIMVRESLEVDAANFFALLSGAYGVRGQVRKYKGNETGTYWDTPWPYNSRDDTWIMLTRSGNKVRIYESDDGEDWSMVKNEVEFEDTVLNGDQLFAGIAITSHKWDVLAEATIEGYESHPQASVIKCLRVFETAAPSSPTNPEL